MDLQELKIWDTPPGKEPRSANVFVEGQGNTEWVAEEDSHKYHIQLHGQLQELGLQL